MPARYPAREGLPSTDYNEINGIIAIIFQGAS